MFRPTRPIIRSYFALSKRYHSSKAPNLGNNTRLRILAGFLGGSLCGFYLSMNQTLSNPPEFLFPHSSTTKVKDIPSPQYGSKWDFDLAVEELKLILKEDQISKDFHDLESHSTNDYALHPPDPDQRPKLIVYPGSTEEVSEVIKIAHEYRIPVIPFGGGTAIEGQFISSRSSTIIIDLSRMDKIVSYNKHDLDVTVQSGVEWQELNSIVGEDNLMIGCDPAPGALIGGMVNTSCSGTNAFRYGTMKENVVNLTVVLADGTVIKTQNRPKKSSNGYYLTGLFIGSEGTLGVITEVTLKLHVKSRFETVAVATFDSILDASKCVTEIIQHGIKPNAIELLDERMMECINYSTQSKWEHKPTLFFKIGSNNSKILKETIKEIQSFAKKYGNKKFILSKNEKEQTQLWSARKAIFWSSIDYGRAQISKDVKIWSTDVAVPISNLPKMIKDTVEDCNQSGLYSTIVGHVGDGNFHCLLMYLPHQSEEAQGIIDRMVDRSLFYDGTCSGEHGIGYSKRDQLEKELGIGIDLMRKIKFSLDPLKIMNPDKIFKIDPHDRH
ncbi:hypothetical protein WICMUC_000357 [Wickerhamomyces mucosus]|uniref:D-lactate dehydrogenase (cytochrome) n=1 Tax=Wickerhamomyces mucosus TaxID=1378264 RepID=A0A9P8PY16_9ASCO|nr:hypothetical protein WICMUC_000357 [Wickerhamomyces mucosus]